MSYGRMWVRVGLARMLLPHRQAFAELILALCVWIITRVGPLDQRSKLCFGIHD